MAGSGWSVHSTCKTSMEGTVQQSRPCFSQSLSSMCCAQMVHTHSLRRDTDQMQRLAISITDMDRLMACSSLMCGSIGMEKPARQRCASLRAPAHMFRCH